MSSQLSNYDPSSVTSFPVIVPQGRTGHTPPIDVTMEEAATDFSQFDNVPAINVPIRSHAGASFFCDQIRELLHQSPRPLRILIAGCGAGHEAVAIQQELQSMVDAVDVEDFVAEELKQTTRVQFQVASVCELPFAANTFDAIFYHHVIEHVDRPADSLVELHRVLKPGGWIFIGTPNRHRLLSSIGAHEQSEWEATFMNKLVDNLRDWKDRFTGRFRNELGAHAGFSRGELDRMLASQFTIRRWQSREYLHFKYSASKFASLLPIITHPALCWCTAPGIYVFCQK